MDYPEDMKVDDHFSNSGNLAQWYSNKFINFELYTVNSLNKNSGQFLILNKISPKTNIQEP